MKKLLVFLTLVISNITMAGESIQILSDAETENYIKSLVMPLIKAANLKPDNVNIRIIADPELNAFVTNGANIFINSGLIIKFSHNPNVLYGVMAHEIAHVYASHLVKMRGKYDDMSKVAIGGTILGLASFLAGAPEGGALLTAGSIQAAQSGMLQYSRANEVEADKIAVDLLYKTHNNGLGLIEFFEYVSKRDREFRPDPYSITHPLSNERIASVQNSIKEKLGKFGNNITPTMEFGLRRIAVKLQAFLASPKDVINKYKNDDYGLSIGYFRSGKLEKADKLLSNVLAKEPNNPYLWELRGQFYFENGKFDKSEQYYQKALSYLPNDNLIKLELALAKLNQGSSSKDRVILNEAVKLLKQVIIKQPDNLAAYFTLSRAYGLLDNKTGAILALSEYYFYQGSYKKSRILANKLIKMAPEGSREYIKATDIIEISKNKENEKN